jgi:hypothetical protein
MVHLLTPRREWFIRGNLKTFCASTNSKRSLAEYALVIRLSAADVPSTGLERSPTILLTHYRIDGPPSGTIIRQAILGSYGQPRLTTPHSISAPLWWAGTYSSSSVRLQRRMHYTRLPSASPLAQWATHASMSHYARYNATMPCQTCQMGDLSAYLSGNHNAQLPESLNERHSSILWTRSCNFLHSKTLQCGCDLPIYNTAQSSSRLTIQRTDVARG